MARKFLTPGQTINRLREAEVAFVGAASPLPEGDRTARFRLTPIQTVSVSRRGRIRISLSPVGFSVPQPAQSHCRCGRNPPT